MAFNLLFRHRFLCGKTFLVATPAADVSEDALLGHAVRVGGLAVDRARAALAKHCAKGKAKWMPVRLPSPADGGAKPVEAVDAGVVESGDGWCEDK